MKIGAAAAGVVVLASCSRFFPQEPLPAVVPPADGTYDLTREAGGILTDSRLEARQHPFLAAIQFSFTPDPQLGWKRGNLIMVTTHKQDSEYRLITNETDNRSEGPGIIYARSRLVKAGVLSEQPVIRFAFSEEYLISLGFKLRGEDCLKTYQDMETYYINRDRYGYLWARYAGLRSFNPDASYFKPRNDAEARSYFDKSCLS